MIRNILFLAALIVFSLALWFAGPLVAVSGYAPLEGLWPRLAILLGLWLCVAAWYGTKYWRKRRAVAALEKAIATPDPEPGDTAQLSEKLSDALALLKRSSGKRGYLYDLPWYVIIGPPGAGKTTALINSGLKFPLAANGAIEAVAGAGGTRYCDWWFTEDAVLIDTAGRYTTQDSNAQSDQKSWLSFLSLLKENRPKQPINGILVAISIEDLLLLSRDELELHAHAIRTRLKELREELQIDFPVYAIFTKADKISGFREFFQTYGEDKRRQVWGATFQGTDHKQNSVAGVPTEIDDLVYRLTQDLSDRLQEEPDALARIAIFGFPAKVAALKEPLSRFLTSIFEPTRYQSQVSLRGFYFTSGTQEGTAFDELLGAMGASNFESHSPFSGRGKSFFIHDLLKKVVFAEAGLVGYDPKAVRRIGIIRYGAAAVIAILTLALSALWIGAYTGNRQAIDSAEASVLAYHFKGNVALNTTPVADTDLIKILPPLLNISAVYDENRKAAEAEHWYSGLGLSQKGELAEASKDAYRVALERTLRPRLMLRLEQQIAALEDDPAATYEALKVYLMLGGLTPKTDRGLIEAWMAQDWENRYPGPEGQKARDLLSAHLDQMLILSAAYDVPNMINAPLVDAAQKSLLNLGLAERAYAMIKSAAASEGLPAWHLADHADGNADAVFKTGNGQALDSLQVGGLYTYDGFRAFFLPQLADIRETLQDDIWVLGPYGQKQAIGAQFSNLERDLMNLYQGDFIRNWEAILNNVQLKSLTADKPTYSTIATASGPASPIAAILAAIRDETSLTKDRQSADKTDNGGAVADGATEFGKTAAKRLIDRTQGLSRVALDIALKKSQARLGESGAREQTPGATIEAHFRDYHQLVEGAFGQRPVDALIRNLYEIYQDLLKALLPTEAERATGDLQNQIVNLRMNTSRLPRPLARMMEGAILQFEGDAADTTIEQLNQQLTNEVTGLCRQVTGNHYPFSKKAKTDAPIQDFARLFAPNGALDRFFNTNLARYADISAPGWKWKQSSRLGQQLSPEALQQFERASAIRDAFFAGGMPQPSIQLVVNPQSLSGNADTALLEISRTVIEFRKTPSPPQSINWNGGPESTASIQFFPPIAGYDGTVSATGSWALMRLLDRGSIKPRGQSIDANFVIGGRGISLRLDFASLKDPFVLPELQSFSCPDHL